MINLDSTEVEDWTPIHPSAIKNPQHSENQKRIPLHIPVPPPEGPSRNKNQNSEYDDEVDFDISTVYNL